MNIYALFPLIATVAYIPLLASTASTRPLQRRHKLFILFLIPAMVWSLIDYLFRSNFFPEYNFLLFQGIIIAFSVMAVQFHCFTSSFFAPGQGRWLPFAYVSLAGIFAMVLLGYLPESVGVSGDRLFPQYGRGVIFLAAPLLILTGRNFHVFVKRLKIINNPVLYNQIVSLMLGYTALVTFTLAGLLPWGKEIPISHFGNLINAFILSYAAMRHQLVDIKIVLRQGSAMIALGVIGAATYWFILVVLHALFEFQLDLTATFTATMVAVVVAIFTYRLRNTLFVAVSRIFQGQSYDHRQQLSEFASKIQNIFSLKEQGGELLMLVTKAIGCKKACLLFPDIGNEDFITQIFEPKENNLLSDLKLRHNSPILDYLGRERKPLSRENLATLPEFLSLWEQEKKEIKSGEIEVFIPLISRERVTAILVLGKKQSGIYSLEDFSLLADVAERVAVSMEKEYLREQLREREQELSVINRSSAIIASNFDVQEIYGSFIDELKKVMDVSWAAITLVEEDSVCFLALSSEVSSAWQEGERIPIKGTVTEWVAKHKKSMVVAELTRETKFATGKYLLQQGIQSTACLPLIVKGEVIGSLIVASCNVNAYNQRHIKLLEQLASQIAMPVENTRLYAKAEEKARVDELTGMLNRRSLDEMLASEIGRHSRYGGIFSVIILDLDSFKVFNDTYGHLAGDKLLRQAGNVMKGAIRGADQAFRYGGDEFAILLPQTSIDAAYQVSERVRKQVALKIKSGDVPITASLGLATWPADGIGSNELIAMADAALYHAKRSGGNRSHCASGTLLPLDKIALRSTGNQDSGSLSTIYSLAATVDSRDHYTRNHSKRVSEYALAIAEALHLEPLELSRLETCALLHDVGKIGVSDEILNKPSKLTDEELEVVKRHPELGATIAGRVRQLTSCVAGILHHHERFDGTGYPEGLEGENIPLESRILTVADAFAALTSDRPYAEALSCEAALKKIRQGAGTQFDPKLVEVFATTAVVTEFLPKEKVRGGEMA